MFANAFFRNNAYFVTSRTTFNAFNSLSPAFSDLNHPFSIKKDQENPFKGSLNFPERILVSVIYFPVLKLTDYYQAAVRPYRNIQLILFPFHSFL
ncbi:hypothetical protein DYU05_10630 [Mucilaginibacter terrenus]|uniref:Uncharacterized protein n=1 Tax=Mucilaginibacter terrenus TaxID=2482727 RepID=A0A3E2NNU4_9SPHI|nr:hypothetical protein DYU05_10630 [Mucilaginibacter terrenus]